MSETTEKIVGFLKGMKFKKKVFGGVDEQEVLKKFSELDALYQAAFLENMGAAKEKIASITDQLEAKQSEVSELTSQIDDLKSKLAGSQIDETMANKVQQLESLLSDLRKQYDETSAAKVYLEKENQQLKEQQLSDRVAEEPIHNEMEYQELQSKIQELQSKLDELSDENADLQKQIEEYKNAAPAEPTAPAASVDDGVSDESVIAAILELKKQLMSEAFEEKEKIILNAHKDAEKIISAAELDRELIRIKSTLDVQHIAKEREQLAKELNRILEQIQGIFSESDTTASDAGDADDSVKSRTLDIMETGLGQEMYDDVKPDGLLGNA